MTVRVAGDADLPALAALRRAWTIEADGSGDEGDAAAPPDQLDPDFEVEFARWWRAEAGRRTAWLAEADGAAVGMLNVFEFRRMPRPGVQSAAWGYVSNVYVRPSHRGRGIGAALLDAAAREARRRGYVRLVLNPSEASRPLYGRAGYLPAAEDLLIAHLPD